MAGNKMIATLGCAGVGAIALIFGLYSFYLGVQLVLEKSELTASGAHNAGGSTFSPIAVHEASNSPLYLFLNNSFADSGLRCDDVFDSMTVQFVPLMWRSPPFNATQTPYSPSDFTGVAADGNAKGAFEKVCAKDPNTHFFSELILLAKADYATCKGDCDWTFCRSSTLNVNQEGGLVFNCDFQYTIQTTWPISGVAGANVEQGKKLWENLWNAMDCREDYHVYCSELDKAATEHWQTARNPLYAGVALLLVAVLLHCFMPADAQPQQESPGAELMS